MAKITDFIEIKDGVSPVFEKMANASYKLSEKLSQVSGDTMKLSRVTPTLTNNIDKATGAMGRFTTATSVFVGNLFADMAMRGVIAVNDMKDNFMRSAKEYSTLKARLTLVTGDKNSAKLMNDAIYQSAQRARGEYMAMAETATHLAQSAQEVFKNPLEAVTFTESVQKLFAIGGTGAEQQKAALLQLGQSLASGVLQGDEFRSIAENAPIIENMLAKELGVTRGKLKSLSSQGKITSELIKRTIMKNVDEINEKFGSIPMKWSDIAKNLKNELVRNMASAFEVIERSANAPVFKAMTEDLKTFIRIGAKGITVLVNNIVYALTITTTVFQRVKGFFQEYKKVARGAVIAISGALGILAIAQAKNLVLMGISATATLTKAIADTMATASLIAMTFAQEGFNTALALCPMTWIIGAVIIAIGVFYGLVEIFNKFTGLSISATGLIVGAFAWLGSSIANVFIGVANNVIAFVEFFANVWHSPLDATYNLFADIWNGIADLVGTTVNSIIDMINQIPGLDKSIGKFGKIDIAHVNKKVIKGGMNINRFELLNAGKNAVNGYNYGATMFNGDVIGKLTNGIASPFVGGKNTVSDEEKQRTEDTKGIRKALETSTDDMRFLREVAEREVINKYTTATINIDAGGLNISNSNNSDFDGMLRKFADVIQESVISGAESVQR